MKRIERRKHRSDKAAEAARLYLERVADDHALSALALADSQGLLVVGTRGDVDAEAVAAVAPLAAETPHEPRSGLLDLVTRGEPLKVWGVRLDGESFYLAAVGERLPPVADAQAALVRILTASAAAC